MTESKTTAIKTTPDGREKASSELLWIGGGAILVLICGSAIWYIRKKKNEQQVQNSIASKSAGSRSARSSTSGFKCINSKYPLSHGTCHEDVKILQRYLKNFKMNLGSSGVNKDGVDGQFGNKTRSAALKVLKKDTFFEADIKGLKQSLAFAGK
ncbi:MAG: peptidoglycan-binding protein [Cyclobacteriaceae bacterium]